MSTVQARIDKIYDDMRALVTSRQGEPGLREALKPLRAELRRLQEIEADEIERQYTARFKFDPRAADRAIERAEKLLEKQT